MQRGHSWPKRLGRKAREGPIEGMGWKEKGKDREGKKGMKDSSKEKGYGRYGRASE